MMLLLWSLLSLAFRLFLHGIARAFKLFLQGPGAWWMGLIVRNAAFGGQCKKVLRPHELPERERAYRETISDTPNQKMNDLSRKTAAQAGEALYSALAEGDAMQLKEHILARLTDPKLAHCQYYCEDEIINRIAELIASPLPSVASGFGLPKQSALSGAKGSGGGPGCGSSAFKHPSLAKALARCTAYRANRHGHFPRNASVT